MNVPREYNLHQLQWRIETLDFGSEHMVLPITILLFDISQMFHSAFEDEYNVRLVHYSKTWDLLFEQY